MDTACKDHPVISCHLSPGLCCCVLTRRPETIAPLFCYSKHSSQSDPVKTQVISQDCTAPVPLKSLSHPSHSKTQSPPVACTVQLLRTALTHPSPAHSLAIAGPSVRNSFPTGIFLAGSLSSCKCKRRLQRIFS